MNKKKSDQPNNPQDSESSISEETYSSDDGDRSSFISESESAEEDNETPGTQTGRPLKRAVQSHPVLPANREDVFVAPKLKESK